MKHFLVVRHYLCNNKIRVSDETSTIDVDAVTCKTCKKVIEKINSLSK